MTTDSEESQSFPDLDYIRELAKIITQHGLGEIEIEAGEQRVLLRRGEGALVSTVGLPAKPTSTAHTLADPLPHQVHSFVTSPFVGTFFHAAKPDLPPFVEVGQKVTEGQPLCLIEAMKLFNEIEADFPCVIEETLVKNGQPVEYGTRLFRVMRL